MQCRSVWFRRYESRVRRRVAVIRRHRFDPWLALEPLTAGSAYHLSAVRKRSRTFKKDHLKLASQCPTVFAFVCGGSIG